MVGGSRGVKDRSMIAEWAEMKAFEESLKVAKRLKKQNIMLESNYANLINKINKRENDVTILGSHIKALCTQFQMYDSVKVTWTNRSNNLVADFICHFIIKNNC